jgi:hypothetical protein
MQRLIIFTLLTVTCSLTEHTEHMVAFARMVTRTCHSGMLHIRCLYCYCRFDIIKKLGQGTYGKVQLGINKETGQEVRCS